MLSMMTYLKLNRLFLIGCWCDTIIEDRRTTHETNIWQADKNYDMLSEEYRNYNRILGNVLEAAKDNFECEKFKG